MYRNLGTEAASAFRALKDLIKCGHYYKSRISVIISIATKLYQSNLCCFHFWNLNQDEIQLLAAFLLLLFHVH